MYHLPFRQVHLDFHTSEQIAGIGSAFDRRQWQRTLLDAHVNSITLFAKCHHGWHYHFTQKGQLHPHLKFDLLRSQFEACKEVGIRVPIYLSAGIDNRVLREHPEWQLELVDPATLKSSVASNLLPGFHRVCFNSPYTELLAEQIQETLTLFPNCDGIFLDIISQRECCCEHCLRVMAEHGLDPLNAADRRRCAELAVERYYQVTTQAARAVRPDIPIFHNSGHVAPGRRQILEQYFTHLELESLPTGGWGYDHFPLSAKYAGTLNFDYSGMTGKFHTSWGEFGGFKHPDALRYECAAMLAFGAKCSIGDQLHPTGKLDESTYKLIGSAYAEVETKEPWCDNVVNVAEVAILSAAINGSGNMNIPGDIGAGRLLLEGHFLFEVIDLTADFSRYKLLILPDQVEVDAELQRRLEHYIQHGGKLLLSGQSGLDSAGHLTFDCGGETVGDSPFQPDYVQWSAGLAPAYLTTPMVMYLRAQRLKLTDGEALGKVFDSYFNRTDARHFCSHLHTPCRPDASAYVAGVRKNNVMYFAHPVFAIYRGWGNVALGEVLRQAVAEMLGEQISLQINLPSTARVSLMHQKSSQRYILHLLFGNPVARGGEMNFNGEVTGETVEVIEDLVPLHNIKVKLRLPHVIKKLRLVPQKQSLDFRRDDRNFIHFVVPEFCCHQMIELAYDC